MARDRNAPDAAAGVAARGRAGGGHDAAGDRAHRRAAAVACRETHCRRGRARHGLRAFDCKPGHGAPRRAGARRGRHGPRAERSASDRSLPGRMSLLSIKGLNQSYGGSHTLWDVDLDVESGSRTCLMGRNGMGKTTLLKCVMGLLPITSGTITFNDIDLRSVPAEGRARLGIGYVPQGREIFPQLTVEENLRIGLGVRPNGPRTVPPRIYELFPVLK